MSINFIYFYDLSAWWLFLIGLLSIVIAYILYFFDQQRPYFRINYYLFTVRFLIIFLTLLLILNPLIKANHQRIEKPIIILAIDASKSIINNKKNAQNASHFKIQTEVLSERLAKIFNVEKIKFGSSTNNHWNGFFNDLETNFDDLFSFIQDNFSENNIGAVIIASDGLVNKGSENISKKKYPVYTIALGDTILKRDIAIQTIHVNPEVSINNTHQIKIDVSAKGLKGNTASINISTSDGQYLTKTININDNIYFDVVSFTIKTNKKGIQRINANINNVGSENILENNKRQAFTNVIENKYHILVYYNGIHPDITAIKSGIENSKSYEVDVTNDYKSIEFKKFDLAIFYNTPINTKYDDYVLKRCSNIPKIFFLGQKTSQEILNQNITNSNIFLVKNAYQSPIINSNFYEFPITDNLKNEINRYPSILQYFSVSYKSSIINSINHSSPIVSLNENVNNRYIIFNGEGFWRWRIKNFVNNKNFNAFDELINKSIQWLIVNKNDDNFIIKPTNYVYKTNEKVQFETYINHLNTLHNEINDIHLQLKNKQKIYNYHFSKNDSNNDMLEVGYLPKGNYTYSASTLINNTIKKQIGEIVIDENYSELDQNPSNIEFLESLSKQSAGGRLFKSNELPILYEEIAKNTKIKPLIKNNVKYIDLVNLKLILLLIISLLTLEWFVRKRNSLQ